MFSVLVLTCSKTITYSQVASLKTPLTSPAVFCLFLKSVNLQILVMIWTFLFPRGGVQVFYSAVKITSDELKSSVSKHDYCKPVHFSPRE